jgi:branched-chain amino acid transport system permease protein
VAIMVWRPRGIVGSRSPTIVLKKAHAISSDVVKEGHA